MKKESVQGYNRYRYLLRIRKFLAIAIFMIGVGVIGGWGMGLLSLSGCGSGGGSNDGIVTTPTDTGTDTGITADTGVPGDTNPGDTEPVPLSADVIGAAASFLGAAAGKEDPIGVDDVVFVNSVLGINNVPREQKCLYGDLWIVLRDEYGIPILDDNGCQQPIASEPVPIVVLDINGEPIQDVDDEGNPLFDEDGNPIYQVTYSDYVPMMLEEFQDEELKCSVVLGFEIYTQELSLGRLNMVRSSVQNPEVMARGFSEVMKNLNAADKITADLSGRLVMHSEQQIIDDITGEIEFVQTTATVDSPRESLALYRALLVEGRLAGYGVETRGEEGEIIAAPWLELRPDLPLGDQGELNYLRDGTPGRTGGVSLINNYADFTSGVHDTQGEYQNIFVDFVQYYDPTSEPPPTCTFEDATADLWLRILNSEQFYETNIAAVARHADDSRRIIFFTHEIIQDLPEENTMASLPPMAAPLGEPSPTDSRLLDVAGALLGASASKTVPLSVDGVVFLNTILGINELGISDKGELFGDLWVTLRDVNGVPILTTDSCTQPIATEPLMIPEGFPQLDINGEIIPVFDINGDQTLDSVGIPIYTLIASNYVPMFREDFMDISTKCAIVPGYEEYVQEFEMGRLNAIRSAAEDPHVLERQLVEAIATLNKGTILKRDLGGRLVFSVLELDESGVEQLVDHAIDSPLQNLALYRALMLWGKLEGDVVIKLEGVETTVHLALKDELNVDDHGLGFLKEGGAPSGGIDRLASGYANFSGYKHDCALDYSGIDISYVQSYDPAQSPCSYSAETEDIWIRVLGEDDYVGDSIQAFTNHADDCRKVTTFAHNIIQDIF